MTGQNVMHTLKQYDEFGSDQLKIHKLLSNVLLDSVSLSVMA